MPPNVGVASAPRDRNAALYAKELCVAKTENGDSIPNCCPRTAASCWITMALSALIPALLAK